MSKTRNPPSRAAGRGSKMAYLAALPFNCPPRDRGPANCVRLDGGS
jgi:hypothetical protein